MSSGNSQLKTVRYYCVLELIKSKILTLDAVRMWSNINLHSLLVIMQNYATTLEDSMVVSYKIKYEKKKTKKKLNMFLPYNPAIILLGMCPNDMKTWVHEKTSTHIFK